MNTKFFHTLTKTRRRRNKIYGLFLPNGSWCFNDNILQVEAVSFYKSLFCSNDYVELNALEDVVVPRLLSKRVVELAKPITKEEVGIALRSMGSYKAPSKDGFHALFLKKYWDMVGDDDVWRLVYSAFKNGSFNQDIVETLVVLILESERPTTFKQFRPISLCNVIYKLITKVLVNRLRPFLDDLIGPLQSNFIPGHSTSNNALIAQKVIMHFMYKTRGK
uniref:Reverse transcriptase domain-containing protein n=1 Tax=Populus alba TaxID=43335 RepID=A0A4U5NAE3_POPAL|nr:hypothetical protein D5086_0000272600 [Populus alba]